MDGVLGQVDTVGLDMSYDSRMSLIKRLEKEADFYKSKDPGLVSILEETIYNLKRHSKIVSDLETQNERLKMKIDGYDESIKRFTDLANYINI